MAMTPKEKKQVVGLQRDLEALKVKVRQLECLADGGHEWKLVKAWPRLARDERIDQGKFACQCGAEVSRDLTRREARAAKKLGLLT